MSFRTRLLLACVALALLPLVFFGLRARAEVAAQLGARHAERVAALAQVIAEDVDRESAAVASRLDRVAEAMAADNRLRLAVREGGGTRGGVADRAYLLDYAPSAMPLAGLDLLRIQDEEGRILSSGHFRHEYDVVDRARAEALVAAADSGMLASFPTPTGRLLGLVRVRTLRVGERTLTLVGGTAVDAAFLERLARGSGLEVSLRLPGENGGWGAREVAIPFAAHDGAVAPADAPHAPTARFVIRSPTDPLASLRREMDRWLLVTLGGAAAMALLLSLTASRRLGRPLAALARRAERVDLDRLDVDFPTDRSDEVGTLSRVLDRMTGRLRASAARLREAERRAAVGELARQVNHDLRNGLVPIRNVVSHLAELARERPAELSSVFLERKRTLDASLGYLDSLAASYARLSPKLERTVCDLNAIARQVAESAPDAAARMASARASAGRPPTGAGETPKAAAESARVVTELDPTLPRVRADPVALRRILENLVVNALESLDGRNGRVVVWTRGGDRGGAPGAGSAESAGREANGPVLRNRGGVPPRILFGVTDDGRGMTAEERARAFDHFYTTKPEGGGLGLSIVRRLVSDLGGKIELESEPGVGTRVTVELPAGPGAPAGGAEEAGAA